MSTHTYTVALADQSIYKHSMPFCNIYYKHVYFVNQLHPHLSVIIYKHR